jgi:hypothetical protein
VFFVETKHYFVVTSFFFPFPFFLRVHVRLSKSLSSIDQRRQLQLEMLCAGPKCQAAIFGSFSATRGANLFLIQRDDE